MTERKQLPLKEYKYKVEEVKEAFVRIFTESGKIPNLRSTIIDDNREGDKPYVEVKCFLKVQFKILGRHKEKIFRFQLTISLDPFEMELRNLNYKKYVTLIGHGCFSVSPRNQEWTCAKQSYTYKEEKKSKHATKALNEYEKFVTETIPQAAEQWLKTGASNTTLSKPKQNINDVNKSCTSTPSMEHQRNNDQEGSTEKVPNRMYNDLHDIEVELEELLRKTPHMNREDIRRLVSGMRLPSAGGLEKKPFERLALHKLSGDFQVSANIQQRYDTVNDEISRESDPSSGEEKDENEHQTSCFHRLFCCGATSRSKRKSTAL